MSDTTLLAMQRIEAIGGNALFTSLNDPRRAKAEMLVDMAYEQVLAYINLDNDGVDALDAPLPGIVATVVAEMASSRLQYNAAPSSEGFIPEGLITSLMAPRHKKALDMAFRSLTGSDSVSILVLRDEESSYLSPYTPLDLWL